MNSQRPIQLVIPMAGRGTRFSQAGYDIPKPLLPIHGIPAYQVVLGNLIHPRIGSVTVITQRSWGVSGPMRHFADHLDLTLSLIEIDYTTCGPADTIDLARPMLDPELPVVTANSDQYVSADLDNFYASLSGGRLSGQILTMEDTDPKWSYAALDADGYVRSVKEKQVISRFATVGIYGFREASLMFGAFDDMRIEGDMTNGEYYVAPSYNWLITRGHRVGISHLGPVGDVMHGLGVPADYERFLESSASRAGAQRVKDLIER